jgi:hemolysin III
MRLGSRDEPLADRLEIDALFMATSLPAIALLAVGGILYSAGVLFHLWERLAYQQPIWHGCVAAAAACHYAPVLGEIALPGTFT